MGQFEIPRSDFSRFAPLLKLTLDFFMVSPNPLQNADIPPEHPRDNISPQNPRDGEEYQNGTIPEGHARAFYLASSPVAPPILLSPKRGPRSSLPSQA